MCQPSRSCNINEDTGLGLAYTIAHELGHKSVSNQLHPPPLFPPPCPPPLTPFHSSFGAVHDGTGECSLGTHHQHIMSPHLMASSHAPVLWSKCSREAITKFLECVNLHYIIHITNIISDLIGGNGERVCWTNRRRRPSERDVFPPAPCTTWSGSAPCSMGRTPPTATSSPRSFPPPPAPP